MPPKVKTTKCAGRHVEWAVGLRELENYYPDLLSALCQELGWPKVTGLKLSYKEKCHLKSKTTKCASRHAEPVVGLRELEN